MKKIIIFCLIVIIIIIGLKRNDDFKISKIEGVTLEIKEGTLSKNGATIIITDINSEKYIFGLDFHIQKLINGKWKKLKINKIKQITPIGYLVNEDNKLEMEQNWKDTYGSLSKGKYRLIKRIIGESLKEDEVYISIEFSI